MYETGKAFNARDGINFITPIRMSHPKELLGADFNEHDIRHDGYDYDAMIDQLKDQNFTWHLSSMAITPKRSDWDKYLVEKYLIGQQEHNGHRMTLTDVCRQSQICSGGGRKERSRQRGDWLFPAKSFVLLGVSQLCQFYARFDAFVAPAILQSDNGREFSNQVVSEICTVWKDVKIAHGKPHHSLTQGSVERVNQNMLTSWMNDNDTNK
ncbi:KRAB-A domain-containing protein 2 [Trichonephila clavipes]|nr:KRAB-A domain-containing protein 2 [Trichonephila clavipes]